MDSHKKAQEAQKDLDASLVHETHEKHENGAKENPVYLDSLFVYFVYLVDALSGSSTYPGSNSSIGLPNGNIGMGLPCKSGKLSS